MTDYITLRGWVGTEPTFGRTPTGLPFVNFRMSVGERRFEEGVQAWVEKYTSWYSISCYGKLAENARDSVHKGQRLIVMGKLRIRGFQRQDGSPGLEAQLQASAVGHDLAMGVSQWNKRRDEMPAEASAGRPGLVEGVGIVDPVTGEVRRREQDEDPFEAGIPPFEDDAEPGPDEELLSA